jgi:hypothetical protein
MTDDELMGRLGAIAAVADPPPPGLAEAARALFGLGRLDAELAELVRDSTETLELAVRADGDDRLLSFEAGAATVEMQVSERADRRDVIAHVSGITLQGAAVETLTGQRPLQVDDGVLIARDLTAGPLRLRLTPPAGAAIVTSWVTI